MKFKKASSSSVPETSTSRVKAIANGTIHKPIKIRRTPLELGLSGEKPFLPKLSNGLIGPNKFEFNKNEKLDVPVIGITTEQLRTRRNIKAKIQTLEKQLQEDRDHIKTKFEQKLTSVKAKEVNVKNDPPLNLKVTIKPRLASSTSTYKHAETVNKELVSERQVSLIGYHVQEKLSDESDDIHLLGPNDSTFLELQSDRLKIWRLNHAAADPLYNEVEYMLKLFELPSLERAFYVRPGETKLTFSPCQGRRFGEAGGAKRVRPDDWSDEGLPSKRR